MLYLFDAMGNQGERLSGAVRGEGARMVVESAGCPGGEMMRKRVSPKIICSCCGKPIRLQDIPMCADCRHALAVSDDANREMGLPEGEDWGNK